MSSIPYLILAFFLSTLAYLEFKVVNKKQLKTIRFISVFTISLFFGLRGFILTDFINYYQFFKTLDINIFSDDTNLYSPGIILFSIFIKYIFNNYHFWILTLSLIDISILTYLFRKYIGNISLGILFFLAYRGIVIEFNLIQNIKPILFFFLSIKYLKNRNFIPYLFLNLLGVLFHVSALIYIPLYFVLNRKLSKRLCLIIIITANILLLSSSKIFIDLFFFIINTQFIELSEYLYFFINISPYNIGFGHIERTLVILIIVFYQNKISKKLLHGNILKNLAIIYYASFLVLSPIDVLADRIPILFLISMWVIIPFLILNRDKYRQLLVPFLIAVCFMKIFLSTQDKVATYDNLIFGIDSYEKRSNDVRIHNKNQ